MISDGPSITSTHRLRMWNCPCRNSNPSTCLFIRRSMLRTVPELVAVLNMLLQVILPIATLITTTRYHAAERPAWLMLFLMTLQVRSTTECATTSRAGCAPSSSAAFGVRQAWIYGQGRLDQGRHDRARGPRVGIAIGTGPDVGLSIGVGNADGVSIVVRQGIGAVHLVGSTRIAHSLIAMERRHITPAVGDVVTVLTVRGGNSGRPSQALRAILRHRIVWRDVPPAACDVVVALAVREITTSSSMQAKRRPMR